MAYSLVQPKQKKEEPYHKNQTAACTAHHNKLVDQGRLKLASRKWTRGRNVIAGTIFIWLST